MADSHITIIKPASGWKNVNLREIWRYRDLVFMFIKRNFVSAYKQTILGYLWFLITPVLTSSMFTLIFGKIAGISTDGIPHFLYYLAGNTAWAYFSACLTTTSSTFTGNAYLFGKVYFPRLVMPLSTVIYALWSFLIQMLLTVCVMLWFSFAKGAVIAPNIWLAAVPVLVLHMALLGMGCGIVISALTTKYRDLSILVGFGVQLWMYATPIVYPLSAVPQELKRWIVLNPMTPVINNFRYALLGCGQPEKLSWLISGGVTVVVLTAGIMLFSKIERNFMDTV